MSTRQIARPLPPTAQIWGTVTGSDGSSVRIAGLARLARLGDRIEIDGDSGSLPGEVIALEGDEVIVLLMAPPVGLTTGQKAWLKGRAQAAPSRHWLGKVIDAFGQPTDGTKLPPAPPIRAKPLVVTERRGLGTRLDTGLAALDTFLPLCRGQRLGVFAGSGVGKSRLMSDLALGVSTEVVVIGLIGERTREVGDFVRLLRQAGGMERAVVIAATSDQPALVKRRAAQLCMETAEFFRDEGRQVLCLFDSVTRFAEAHREVALAAGEPPALRAFPPSTVQAISALCERAGPGAEGTKGDITAIFTVLVAGSDMDEPVADMVRGVLDGHVVLDRAIAERGRFPAINVRRSVSRSAPEAWTGDGEDALVAHARRLIASYEEASPMIQAGLYVAGADPVLDEAVLRWEALDAFSGSVTRGHTVEENFVELGQILGVEAASEAPNAEETEAQT
ncbi:MAG: FliI/YscN family ATPase [Paracoccaceae bacterium]